MNLQYLENKKKKEEAVNFCARDLEELKNWRKPISHRIKIIDSLRLHLPTDVERRNLRIPAFLERVNIQEDGAFLMMCGGHNAVQFSIKVCLFTE
jgi:hypothetical protein